MKTTWTLTLLLSFAAYGAAGAETFRQVPIAPEAGVEVFDRGAAREGLGRDLLSNPYATVVIANVDVYDAFPYLEARYFQVVSDPGWNRLLLGEAGTGLTAFDGKGTITGPLSEPRGMALGADGRIYLADSGNHRLVILEARSEFDRLELIPVGTVEDLRRPYDVAYSDGGTPMESGDDRIYVAETGRNRVVSYRIEQDGVRFVNAIGELGSGSGRFAGPLAIGVGRRDGANTTDIFVADAHNRRLVHLEDKGDELRWRGEVAHRFDVVTSLDTDQWGNLYVTGPGRGTVAKYSARMEPVAEMTQALDHPRSFHVVFADVHDHTTGEHHRGGQAHGVVVESWADRSGIRLVSLGVDLDQVEVETRNGVAASFLVTDRAQVSAEIVDAAAGTVVARREGGTLDAGSHRIEFEASDFLADLEARDYTLRLTARSLYEDATPAQAEAVFEANGTEFVSLPQRPMLLGNRPNPFQSSTSIQFLIPDGPPRATTLRVFDLQGRLVRTLLQGESGPGSVSVSWNGQDESGLAVGSGIYLYQVVIGGQKFTDKMILIR